MTTSKARAALALAAALIAAAACSGSAVSPSPISAPTPAPTAAATPTPTPSPTLTASPSPTPAPQLPALLGAIGDSYTRAWSVSPKYLYDHPQFSWVVGTDAKDGVFSILERLQALGDSPIVVDAAKSGRKMSDAPRQAAIVAAAAKKLRPGQTAYVTFELSTNDECDDPKTDLVSFEADMRSAIAILKAALPAGSRILIYALPDFSHFRDITQADATARANLAGTSRCAPFLGDVTPVSLGQAKNYIDLYDGIMAKVCLDLATDAAKTGRLYCTWNRAKLSMSDFMVADLSSADYFHPSLSGQAKMAAAAWATDVWRSLPLPTPGS
jgi:hypothetical protein